MASADKTPGPVATLIRAWVLTLVCPGLGQMRYGARARGVATLVVVAGSLAWLGWADYVALNQAMQAKVAAGAATLPELMGLIEDPALMAKLAEVSAVPGGIFCVSFFYSFADCAYIAFTRK